MNQDIRVVASGGVSLVATVTGEGLPILMIPGLGASRRVYDSLVFRLARSCTTIVFDPRGVGESDFTPGPYSMDQLAADAISVLRSAGFDRAVIFGASMGGRVAQYFALDHQPAVSALILACTSAGGRHDARAPAEVTDALLGKGTRTPGEAYRLACTVLYSHAFQLAHPDFIDFEVTQRERQPVRPGVFSAQFAAVRDHDTYERLPDIHVPTLVMHGTKDAITPIANAETLAARIPGAQHYWFTGLGHLFFHEDPDATVPVIQEFLTSRGLVENG